MAALPTSVSITVRDGADVLHLEQPVRTGIADDIHLALDHLTDQVHALLRTKEDHR